MKRSHALIVLLVLIGSTVVSSLHGYGSAKARVDADLRQALALTMQEQPSDVITADTIRVFNSHLQMAELRGRATLAVDTRQRHFRCYAHCSEATVFSLSDQRPATALLMLTVAWAALCLFWRRGRKDLVPAALPAAKPIIFNASPSQEYGGLCLADGTFISAATGEEVHLTPMQHQLMELFFRSPRHVLSKTEICEALWPKKDDPSETLYTLIRRLKPIVEQHSALRIASDRGRAYRLSPK